MSKPKHLIVLLPGDGIGPEVVAEAKKVLDVIAEKRKHVVEFEFREELIGGAAIDATGKPLPEKTLASCKQSSAVLLGAVGGPKWGTAAIRPEQGLLEIRKALDLYANIRPCYFPSEALIKHSPLKEEYAKGTEFIVMRELTGGIYYGDRQEENADGVAFDTMIYNVSEIERITRIAASIANLYSPPWPIISVDKANVLATSRLWRKTVTRVLETEYPNLKFSHQLVDSCSMIMVKSPKALNGVLLMENMFGDILSDESSIIPGSLGLLPSASLNGWGKKAIGLYEPIHGSAPDIAGMGIANPIGTILSLGMMFRYSLGLEAEALAIENAVRRVLDDKSVGGYGMLTKDLGGGSSTTEIGAAVVRALTEELAKLNSGKL